MQYIIYVYPSHHCSCNIQSVHLSVMILLPRPWRSMYVCALYVYIILYWYICNQTSTLPARVVEFGITYLILLHAIAKSYVYANTEYAATPRASLFRYIGNIIMACRAGHCGPSVQGPRGARLFDSWGGGVSGISLTGEFALNRFRCWYS